MAAGLSIHPKNLDALRRRLNELARRTLSREQLQPLLLLDAAESYHREVQRTSGIAPEEVRRLLPRLRDPAFTKILLVTLPEATSAAVGV